MLEIVITTGRDCWYASELKERQDICVINDPLGQAHNLTNTITIFTYNLF